VKLLPVIVPVAEIVQVGAATIFVGVLSTDVHAPTSPELKPLPVIVTAVETGPDIGTRAMLGPVTVNVAEAKSPLIPFTVTTYVPKAAVFAAVKVAGGINCPLEFMVHVGAMTMLVGLLRTLVHAPLSAGLNPLPVIVTGVPG